jgi:adenine-specific DNA-methyltransferase
MLAQHLTPPEVATLAASMFSDSSTPINLLDLGAGTGILTIAVAERYGATLKTADAIELDDVLTRIYERDVRSLVGGKTLCGDAIAADTYSNPILRGSYNRIILNPPYKKMAARDSRQAELPVKSPNLYSAFLTRAVEHLVPGGEIVAIIPRSWTNGEYFAPFRKWLLSHCSLDMMHIYESRGEVFEDTDVLQETMIARFSRQPQKTTVRVSSSSTKRDKACVTQYPSSSLILGDDFVVRINPSDTGGLSQTIADRGLCVSTGKVVDFRSRPYIAIDKPDDVPSVPLIYVGNFPGGALSHPLSTLGKGQWFMTTDNWARKQVLPPGCYVVVRRFSAKEEKRRVVAYPLVSDHEFALENHSSYIHAGTSRHTVPLNSPELACGLAAWLDSSLVDNWFRGVSGSTQVNARDIKAMPCPDLTDLEILGHAWHPEMNQRETDAICEELIKR